VVRVSPGPPLYRCDISGCSYSSRSRKKLAAHKLSQSKHKLSPATDEQEVFSTPPSTTEYETASSPDSVGLRRSRLPTAMGSPRKKLRRRLSVDDITSQDSTSSDFMERIRSMSVRSRTSESMSTDSDAHSVCSSDSLRRSKRIAKRANQQQITEDSGSRKKKDDHKAKQKQKTRSRMQSKNMSTDSDTHSVSSTDSLRRSARIAGHENKQRTQYGALQTKNVDDARKHKQKNMDKNGQSGVIC